jgi:transcriptional regulator with XRE-family HTH domain
MDEDANGGPNHLRAWRRFRRMTQEQLAEAVDTTGPVISLLESGDRPLSAKWLRKLAAALNTTPGFLLDHDPANLPTDILDIWNRAEPVQQQQIAALAETVVGFQARTGTDDLAALTAEIKGRKPRR